MSALKYWDGSKWAYLAQGVKGDSGGTGIVAQPTAPDISQLWLDTSVVGSSGSVPVKGTTNQVLAKASNADYDTQWVSAGAGTVTSVTATSPLTGGTITGSGSIGIADASTTAKGAVQLNDTTTSTSTTQAATANSVKVVADAAAAATNTANNAQTSANGKVSGVTALDATISITGTATAPILAVGTVPAASVSGLATSATTDTTDASNITSGTLAAARVATLNQDTTGNAATATNIAAGTTTLASNVTASSLTSFGTDPTTNTQAVDNNSTKIATTAFVVGQAGAATPVINGTAAAGSSLRYSRQDHVHPTDTTRAPSTGIAPTAITGTAYTLTSRAGDQYQSTTAVDVITRQLASGTRTLANGTVSLTTFTPAVTITISNIASVASTAGTDTGGTSVRRMGLFTVNTSTNAVTLVARTASDATLWNTAFITYTRAFDTTGGFPSTYTLNAGTTYAIGFIGYNTGGVYGQPAVVGGATLTVIHSYAPFIYGQILTQTDLPTAATVPVLTTGAGPYARLT